MDKNDKKQMIIDYIKKNSMEDILSKEYIDKKKNPLKKYYKEIQSICSILSVVAIITGSISLGISMKYNNMVEKQIQLMENEQKPIMDVIISKEDECKEELLVVNNGIDALNYSVDIYAYFDVLCNENNMGSSPTRIYMLNAFESLKQGRSDEIAKMVLYTENYTAVSSLKNDLRDIISEYNNLYWDFSFSYLIKVTSIDIMNKTNIDYFIYNRYGVKRIDNEKGDNIVDESDYMIDNGDGSKTSKESFFDLENYSAEQIFKYTLEKIRGENLYHIDYNTNEKVLYGKYEP